MNNTPSICRIFLKQIEGVLLYTLTYFNQKHPLYKGYNNKRQSLLIKCSHRLPKTPSKIGYKPTNYKKGIEIYPIPKNRK